MYTLCHVHRLQPRSLAAIICQQKRFIQAASPPSLPKPPPLAQLVTEKDNAEAADWIAQFSAPNVKIPKDVVELTFSRSSGPGGQVSWPAEKSERCGHLFFSCQL